MDAGVKTILVEPMGFEPTTSSMPSRRAPNCATAPPGETTEPFYITRKAASMRSSLSEHNVRLEYEPMAKVTFLGAAGCVTGSKYLVEAAGKPLLVGCGIFQGSQELPDRNFKPAPLDPKNIYHLGLHHPHPHHPGLPAGPRETGLPRP